MKKWNEFYVPYPEQKPGFKDSNAYIGCEMTCYLVQQIRDELEKGQPVDLGGCPSEVLRRLGGAK